VEIKDRVGIILARFITIRISSRIIIITRIIIKPILNFVTIVISSRTMKKFLTKSLLTNIQGNIKLDQN